MVLRSRQRLRMTKLQDEADGMECIAESFRNDSKFENLRKMYEMCERNARRLHTQIRRLRSSLAQAGRTLVQMRENRENVFDDILLELNPGMQGSREAIARKDKTADALTEQL